MVGISLKRRKRAVCMHPRRRSRRGRERKCKHKPTATVANTALARCTYRSAHGHTALLRSPFSPLQLSSFLLFSTIFHNFLVFLLVAIIFHYFPLFSIIFHYVPVFSTISTKRLDLLINLSPWDFTPLGTLLACPCLALL